MSIDFTPFFIHSDGNSDESLFCIYYPAVQAIGKDADEKGSSGKEAVLFIPPFAEEMNKSRHMMSLQARAMASAGISSLMIDLFGTGDSSGDFSEARWHIWVENIQKSIGWLREHGYSSISCLGVRLSGLLAVAAAKVDDTPIKKIVWWQPVLTGENYLIQILRLRTTQGMLLKNQPSNENTQGLLERLLGGETIEVAGYDIHPELGKALIDQQINQNEHSLPPLSVKIELVELVSNKDKKNSLPVSNLIEHWPAADMHTLVGENFWNARESHINQELIDMTTALLT
jgi:exosortase A-associated hydrolase 2